MISQDMNIIRLAIPEPLFKIETSAKDHKILLINVQNILKFLGPSSAFWPRDKG